MEYDSVRNTFQTGDIIAMSRDQLRSWHDVPGHVIRIFTESEYSHIGIVWVAAGRVFVIESVPPLVRIIPLRNLAYNGFYHIPVNKEFTPEELEYLMLKVGVAGYSKLQALLAYFKRLKIGEDNLFECAELAIAARRLSGVNLGDVATPSAVVQTLLDQGRTLRYIKKEQQ